MRKTPARAKILKVIRSATHPMNYSEIKNRVGDTCNRVTIYRMLLRLEKESLIYRFPDFNGDFRYAICTDSGQISTNNHFQCLECNTVYNLKPENVAIQIPDDYLASTVHILAAGVCSECRAFNEKNN